MRRVYLLHAYSELDPCWLPLEEISVLPSTPSAGSEGRWRIPRLRLDSVWPPATGFAETKEVFLALYSPPVSL